MRPERLSGFSDGVIAIIINIMVLELKVPHGGDLEALRSSLPVFLSYVLSFLYVAIYWNNHHHLLHTCKRVNGTILWANTHLLFWLLLMPAIAYVLLQTAIVRVNGADSSLAQALGADLKGKISPLIYIAGIALAFVNPWFSIALYVLVALIWLI